MWEHKVVKIDYDFDVKCLQNALDKASTDGWELVSVCIESNTYDYLFFFKRPAR